MMPFNSVAMQCFSFRVSTQKLASLFLNLIEESPLAEDGPSNDWTLIAASAQQHPVPRGLA